MPEISINYIAALSRLIELEKLLEKDEMVDKYEILLAETKEGLKYFIDDEGYFIRSLDKDGTRHGVYGAKKHGYFESTPNHDAMAFRIADENQCRKIYDKIKSIPELRPNKLIVANYPGYDELYETDGFFTFGTWVNGGHWATCEARMQLGYYRAGAFEDAKESFKKIQEMAYAFKLDNPLKDFGAELWQPNEPVNCVYDCWGIPGGFLRGLFEYEYKADGIIIYPHIPPSISVLQQKVPVYFGDKRIYISANGHGNISSVFINGKKVDGFEPDCLYLKADTLGNEIYLAFGLGKEPESVNEGNCYKNRLFNIPDDNEFWNVSDLRDSNTVGHEDKLVKKLKRVGSFYSLLKDSGLSNSFEFSMAELILENIQAIHERRKLKDMNN